MTHNIVCEMTGCVVYCVPYFESFENGRHFHTASHRTVFIKFHNTLAECSADSKLTARVTHPLLTVVVNTAAVNVLDKPDWMFPMVLQRLLLTF